MTHATQPRAKLPRRKCPSRVHQARQRALLPPPVGRWETETPPAMSQVRTQVRRLLTRPPTPIRCRRNDRSVDLDLPLPHRAHKLYHWYSAPLLPYSQGPNQAPDAQVSCAHLGRHSNFSVVCNPWPKTIMYYVLMQLCNRCTNRTKAQKLPFTYPSTSQSQTNSTKLTTLIYMRLPNSIGNSKLERLYFALLKMLRLNCAHEKENNH